LKTPFESCSLGHINLINGFLFSNAQNNSMGEQIFINYIAKLAAKMTQNAIFIDCSSYVSTLKGAEWLHSATSSKKSLIRIEK